MVTAYMKYFKQLLQTIEHRNNKAVNDKNKDTYRKKLSWVILESMYQPKPGVLNPGAVVEHEKLGMNYEMFSMAGFYQKPLLKSKTEIA